MLTEGTEKNREDRIVFCSARHGYSGKRRSGRAARCFFPRRSRRLRRPNGCSGSLEGDACLALPSPFDKHQLDARILPIDLRYAAREAKRAAGGRGDSGAACGASGNAMVFFPSYAYLSRVDALLAAEGVPGAAILREARGLAEEKKRAAGRV